MASPSRLRLSTIRFQPNAVAKQGFETPAAAQFQGKARDRSACKFIRIRIAPAIEPVERGQRAPCIEPPPASSILRAAFPTVPFSFFHPQTARLAISGTVSAMRIRRQRQTAPLQSPYTREGSNLPPSRRRRSSACPQALRPLYHHVDGGGPKIGDEDPLTDPRSHRAGMRVKRASAHGRSRPAGQASSPIFSHSVPTFVPAGRTFRPKLRAFFSAPDPAIQGTPHPEVRSTRCATALYARRHTSIGTSSAGPYCRQVLP